MSASNPTSDLFTSDLSIGSPTKEPTCAPALLKSLVASMVIHPEDWHALPREAMALLASTQDVDTLLHQLIELNLINEYQTSRIFAGTMRGLILGNYRVLNRIGAGALGIVFLSEHIQMRRQVAVKVVPVNAAEDSELIARFLREIRSVALLEHPNIVAAIDAGVCHPTQMPSPLDEDEETGDEPVLYYFVMEHLTGMDLEKRVAEGAPSVAEACAWIYQAASGLDAAHEHQLVHRDIKPSNIFITREGNAKLLDFGLVRQLDSQVLTAAHALIGTLDYMAPEQALDASAIDIRADIFGLGATLFFALIGQSPFPLDGSLREILVRRQTQQPLLAARLRKDVPEALDAVLSRMMALNPEERFATPQAVMHALLPFVETDANDSSQWQQALRGDRQAPSVIGQTTKRPRVLVVEQEAEVRQNLARVLKAGGFECLEADCMATAQGVMRGGAVQAALIGLDTPETNGVALMKLLRDNPPCPNLKIIIASAQHSDDELSIHLSEGADDCLCLPLSDVQFVARIKAAVRHKEAQDYLDRLNQQLLELNVELERSLTARTNDLSQTRNSLVLALARLVEYRSTETLAHLSRIQRYCAILAQEASAHPRLAGQIDQTFIETLECVAPLHDLGNVGLPDVILLKAGPLDPEEHARMQTHTVLGAETLQQVAHQFGSDAGYLRMAIDVARHHHENFDGTGYPDGLAGNDIPLAARIVAIADSYDSLRSRRAQRPRLSHASAVQIILEASPGKYDPLLLSSFKACTSQLDRIYAEVQDSSLMD